MGSDRKVAAAVRRGVRIGITVTLAALGTACLLYGIFAGQALAVLHKAIRICLECIGIG